MVQTQNKYYIGNSGSCGLLSLKHSTQGMSIPLKEFELAEGCKVFAQVDLHSSNALRVFIQGFEP